MSIVGIASNVLFSALNSIHRTPSGGNFQQIQSEFLQLGKDLQAGNLTHAQQDFSTLAQNFPPAQPASNSAPLSQAFGALSQDLQDGNLPAAPGHDLPQFGSSSCSSSGSASASPTPDSIGALNVTA